MKDGTYKPYYDADKKLFKLLPHGHNEGYFVSLENYETTIDKKYLSEEFEQGILHTYACLTLKLDCLIGIWTSEKTGLTYYDLSEHWKARSTAISVGKANGQLAIWDITNNKSIEL